MELSKLKLRIAIAAVGLYFLSDAMKNVEINSIESKSIKNEQKQIDADFIRG